MIKVKGWYYLWVIFLVLLCMVKTSVADLNDGLVAYYPFNDNANDESGNGNNGTVYGASLTTDRLGNANSAYSFDGVDDYIDVGSGFNLDAFTLDAWVFIDPATNIDERRVIGKDNIYLSGDRKGFALKTSSPFTSGKDGHPVFGVLIAPYHNISMGDPHLDVIEASSAITAGWHHLAGVRNTAAGRFELYVDGLLVASKTPSVFGSIDSEVHTVIGQVSPIYNGEFFNGLIDEVRIYNRALSDSEIQELYSGTTTTTPTPTATPSPTPTAVSSPASTLPLIPTPTTTQTPAEGNGIVFGFVNDSDENALRGVTVTIDGNGFSDSAETDEEGYYQFGDLAAGDYTLTYEKEGYQTQTQEVSLEIDEVMEVETVVMEITEKSLISGYVLDIKGNPVESVKLNIKGIKTDYKGSTASDADGFFEFKDLDADTYVIVAKKKGYKRGKQTVTLEEGESQEVEIELKKTTKRRGVFMTSTIIKEMVFNNLWF